MQEPENNSARKMEPARHLPTDGLASAASPTRSLTPSPVPTGLAPAASPARHSAHPQKKDAPKKDAPKCNPIQAYTLNR